MDAFRVRSGTLPPEGRTYEVRLTADEALGLLTDAGGVEFTEPLEADLRVLPSNRDLFVLGTVRGRLALQCVRCLQRFERAVDETIHVTFVDEPTLGAGEVELRREDLEVEPLEGGVVDLLAVVVEQVRIATDPHPVCKDDCKGLCPVCGEDRNKVPCDCGPHVVDPRLSVLSGWKPKA